MWLEYELLKNPDVAGYFCLTTSYRLEKNPVDGRHDIIFPLFKFSFYGNMWWLNRSYTINAID